MNRRDLVLAVLASSEGRPYTPVQLQKAIFLITKNVPDIVDDGPGFNFEPYDYGPFDSGVYLEADNLSRAGSAVIAPSGYGRWNTYAATDAGLKPGTDILNGLQEEIRQYIKDISTWVRAQSFSSLVKSIYQAYPETAANSIFKG